MIDRQIQSDERMASYTSYFAAQQQIANIEAIDFFFAQTITKHIETEHHDIWFHLLMALSMASREGHVCLPLSSIANCCWGMASSQKDNQQGFNFPERGKLTDIVSETDLNFCPEVVFANESLYMRRNFQFEQELSSQLSQRISQVSHFSIAETKQVIDKLFPDANLTETDWQQVAVVNALNKSFSVIAGGPGTGKTYTVTKLLAALLMINEQRSRPLSISLVAPTGKAAQRLSESIINAVEGFKNLIEQDILQKIPATATTIHRLLGVIPNQLQFRHHQDNQLDIDVLILDEVSMVDLALMARLFRALPKTTQVILLGDADQLPSVALGNVLADIAPRPHSGYSEKNVAYLQQIIGSTELPVSNEQPSDHVAFLYKSRRFDGEGGVGQLAKRVISGQAEQSWQLITGKTKSDLHYHQDFLQQVSDFAKQYYQPLLHCTDLTQAFEQLSKFRMLSATRQGESGVESLNHLVMESLGKRVTEHLTLYHGLPVMVTENHYGLGLYNGDIGIVWQAENEHLMVAFEQPEGGFRFVMPTRLPAIEVVYAMTIHKTQGSEFSHVCMLLPEYGSQLLSRELLYTGITRAKQQLTLCGFEHIWLQSVKKKNERYSHLSITAV